MRVEVQAILLVAAVVSFVLAATDLSDRFADRTRMIALGLALVTLIPAWDAVSAAFK